jgi:hypothetical protein
LCPIAVRMAQMLARQPNTRKRPTKKVGHEFMIFYAKQSHFPVWFNVGRLVD